jgi:hypothetical protein
MLDCQKIKLWKFGWTIRDKLYEERIALANSQPIEGLAGPAFLCWLPSRLRLAPSFGCAMVAHLTKEHPGTYPLVNYITMENHNFQWVNPLFLWPFSISMLKR